MTSTTHQFHDRLRKARESMNPPLTKVAIGKMLGKSSMAVALWENGKNEPNLSDLMTLSNFYGVSVHELLGLPEGAPSNDRHMVPVIAPEAFAPWSTGNPLGYERAEREYQPGLAAAYRVNSDAVAPACRNGEIAVIERGAELVNNGIYLVLPEEGGPVLRRCKRDGGMCLFTAADPDFPAFKEEDVAIIGRVREVISRKAL